MKKFVKLLSFIAVFVIACTFTLAADVSFFSFLSAAVLAIAPIAAIAKKPLIESLEVQRIREAGIYTGEGDLDLEFADGQAQSFIDEHLNTREFSLSITNNTATSKKILIFPAYFSTQGITTATVEIGGIEYTVVTGFHNHNIANIVARGLAVDAMVGDGTVATDITCASLSKGNIEDFINFIKLNPTRIPEIVLASNNTAQYNKKMVVKRVHPGKDWGEDYIDLKRYLSVGQYRDEKIIVNTAEYNLQLDDQTLLYLEVEGKVGEVATKVDITLRLGASINTAKGLYARAIQAIKGIRNVIHGR